MESAINAGLVPAVEHLDSGNGLAELAVIRAAGSRAGCYTPSALNPAVAALRDVVSALERHGLAPVGPDAYDALAGPVLTAAKARADVDADVPVDTVDVAELLREAVRAADAPVREDPVVTSDRHGYAVLARGDRTPPWGPDRDAHLILAVNKPDYGAHAAISEPWEWRLAPALPGGGPALEVYTGGAPTLARAAEVGQVAAAVLAGDIRLP